MRAGLTAGLMLAATALLAACAAPATPAAPPAPSTPASPTTSPTSPTSASNEAVVAIHKLPRLPANGQLDYQIGGPYAPAAAVAVVDRDRHEQPVPGRFNICYVNAFQTQPEDAAFWTGRHPDLLAQRDGKPITDADWPGEYLLDTSTAAKRDALTDIVGPWVDGCATSGFDAVEPDNLDSWTRSHGALNEKGNLAFATLLAQRAHAHGLIIGQKNTVELGRAGRTQVHFDFAVAEECQVYDECDGYTDVYGDQVVEVEYTDNARSAYTKACRARGSQISVILRDRDVVPKGRKGYAYAAC